MEYTVRPYKKGEEQYVAEAHRRIYREEYNWGPAFSEYAAAIALDFAKKEHGPGEELWVAEDTAASRAARPRRPQRACADVPEVVRRAVALKYELVPHVVAGARPGLRVRAVALLQLRIELFVNDRYLTFVLHGLPPA